MSKISCFKNNETMLHDNSSLHILHSLHRIQDILGTLDSATTGIEQLSFSTSGSRPALSLPSGWNNLPLECLEVIVEVLDNDTTTLANLLQVNRQCFFLVVPRLYRDPFSRIMLLSRIKSQSIRLVSDDNVEPESTTSPSLPIVGHTGSSKLRFTQDETNISFILKRRLQEREHILLRTLFSTLIQRLCVRFPRSHDFFYPLQYESCKKFGPYHRKVTWTSQHYLRHFVVIDLEKLCTRKGSSGWFKAFHQLSQIWYLRNGLYAIGMPDYLQRAVLNQPGTDRIQCLRIPMHRMRSYQQRHERAPRDRIASRTGHRYSSQNPQKKEESTNLTVSLNIKKENITNPSAPLIVMDESQRPYCFTFNKLTNLKRFEVFGITDNRCDWDTLDRVLATLLFGNHEGASSIGEGEDSEIRKARSQVNQIKEFSIQTQSQLGARFVKILSYFKNLEVLELQYLSCQDQHSFSICDLQLCRDLKVLRMGAYALWGDGSTIFKDLGRLTNLRELRTTCSSIQFQWIIDAKRKIAQHSKKLTISQGLTSQCTLIEANKIDAKSIHDERHPLFHCLPKLRVLGCAAPPRRVQATLSNVTEAFADQLEELVFCCFRNETSAPSRFEHPFCHLRRLAIRGFKGFDYLSLAQCCPMVELLVIHPSYCFTLDAETPNDIIVEAIVELKRLRCLYLEGIWRISSDQFLKLATDSISLYKIGIHNGKNISLDAYNKADRILNAKSSKYPLRSKGVYRLPESEHPYSLDALYFGYTDE